MALIAYCRMSHHTQKSIDHQIQEMVDYGVERENIFYDVASGSTDSRDGFKRMMDYIRKGDTIVLGRLDRIHRKIEGMIGFFNTLDEKGINLKVLHQPIDTSDPVFAKIWITLMGVFSEVEMEHRKQRQREGIEANRHKFKGRPASINAAEVKKLKQEGMKPAHIAKHMNISRQSVYRLMDK